MAQSYTRHPISAVLTDKEGYTLDNSTPLPVNPAESGAANFSTGHTAIIAATPTKIVDINATRRAVLITNTDTALFLYVGGATVSAATGQEVLPGQSISIPVVGALYGIGSGSLTATFLEVYD